MNRYIEIICVMFMELIKKNEDGSYEIELDETLTISFKIEEELLNKVDEAVRILGYSNRSELIRDAIKEYINFLNSQNSIIPGKK